MRALVLALVMAEAAPASGLGTGCGGAIKAATRSTTRRPKPRKPGRIPAAVGTVQRGFATWYGGSLHGGPTASGERFNKYKMTAAHLTLPMNTRVRVTHAKTGRSVVVRINDRGPYGGKKRIIDISEAAAKQLGIIDEGVAPVVIEVIAQ